MATSILLCLLASAFISDVQGLYLSESERWSESEEEGKAPFLPDYEAGIAYPRKNEPRATV